MAYWGKNLPKKKKKGERERVDTCINIIDSLRYTPENNTPIKIFFKKNQNICKNSSTVNRSKQKCQDSDD